MDWTRRILLASAVVLLAGCHCEDWRCSPLLKCVNKKEPDEKKVLECKKKCSGNDWEHGTCLQTCECDAAGTTLAVGG
jgi:hypothetical protein